MSSEVKGEENIRIFTVFVATDNNLCLSKWDILSLKIFTAIDFDINLDINFVRISTQHNGTLVAWIVNNYNRWHFLRGFGFKWLRWLSLGHMARRTFRLNGVRVSKDVGDSWNVSRFEWKKRKSEPYHESMSS